MGRCLCPIESIPNYTPELIAFSIALLEFIIVVIAYVIREIQLKKTFYGREDVEDIPEEEKLEHEGVIMGNNPEEMKIVQTKEAPEEAPKSLRTPSTGGGVRIMMKRKKARSIISDSPLKNAINLHFTLELDKTMRGFEFINLLEAAVNEVEEFKDVREKLSEEAEDRLTDFLVAKMRTILEQSTQNKWIVHGVIQGRLWKVNGLENLLEQGDIKMNQMLRITAQGPVTPIVLLAYMIEVEMIKPQVSTRTNAYSPGMYSKRRMLTESITQTVTQTPKTPYKAKADQTKYSTRAEMAQLSPFRSPYVSMHTMSTLRSEPTAESRKRYSIMKRESRSAKTSKRIDTKSSAKIQGEHVQPSYTGTPATTPHADGAHQTPKSAKTATTQSSKENRTANKSRKSIKNAPSSSETRSDATQITDH